MVQKCENCKSAQTTHPDEFNFKKYVTRNKWAIRGYHIHSIVKLCPVIDHPASFLIPNDVPPVSQAVSAQWWAPGTIFPLVLLWVYFLQLVYKLLSKICNLRDTVIVCFSLIIFSSEWQDIGKKFKPWEQIINFFWLMRSVLISPSDPMMTCSCCFLCFDHRLPHGLDFTLGLTEILRKCTNGHEFMHLLKCKVKFRLQHVSFASPHSPQSRSSDIFWHGGQVTCWFFGLLEREGEWHNGQCKSVLKAV